MMNLDLRYPAISASVREALDMSLVDLARRAPAVDYEFFDLERLLAHLELIDGRKLDDLGEMIVRLHDQQVHGFAATIEEFLSLGVLEDRVTFVVKKLLAPKVALPSPPSDEMLNTLAECWWGLWLHARHGNLIAEAPFPADKGDADFFVKTDEGDRWVDCTSLAPDDSPGSVNAYLVSRVRYKWGKKFGARPSAASLPAAIAVMLHKGQEHLMPSLILGDIVGRRYEAPPSLWADCPGLQEVWIGLPSWESNASHPELLATWKRPR